MNVAELIVKIGAETTGLQKGLREAETQIKGFKSIGSSMASVGESMTKYVTLPIVAVGVAAGVMAAHFQTAMEMIHTQAGASQGEVERMSQAVLAMGGSVTQGPEELAQALFHIESVGYRGAKALDVLKTAAQGAQVGGAGLEDTASALAAVTLTNIKGTDNYQHAMGVLNATVGAGNMKMTDLVEALKSGIVPTAKVAGLSLSGLTAGLAMMTDEGVPAGVAANRLRTALLMMTNPTGKAQAALAQLGMTNLEMGHDLSKPDGLVKALGDLRTHMQGVTDPAKRLQLIGDLFGGSRSAGTIALLMNNLDRVGLKYRQINKTAGDFNKDLAASNQTASVKIQKAWGAIQSDLIEFGQILLPVGAAIAQSIASVTNALARLSPTMQRVVLVTLGVVAAVGPMLFLVGKTILLIREMSIAFSGLNAVMDANVFALIVIAVIALVAGLVLAYEKVTWFHNAVNTAFGAMQKYLPKVAHDIEAAWAAIWPPVRSAMQAAASFIEAHWGTIKSIAGGYIAALKVEWQVAMAVIRNVIVPVAQAIIRHFNQIKAVGSAAFSAGRHAAQAAKGAFNDVSGALQSVIGWLGRVHWPSPPGWVTSLAGKVGGLSVQAAHAVGMGATGGIVTRPTLSMIGEAGPEAVIPLNRMPGAHPLPRGGGSARAAALSGGSAGGGDRIIRVVSPVFLTGDRPTAREFARFLKPEIDRIRTT